MNVELNSIDTDHNSSKFPTTVLDREVLVLGGTFSPVGITSAKLALILLYKDKAQVVDYHYNVYSFNEWVQNTDLIIGESPYTYKSIYTPNLRILIPYVIRLKDLDTIPGRWKIKFTRYHVLMRDHYQCQYCTTPLTRNDMTIDHVIPRSKGGKTTWENCVSSCKNCNRKKNNRLPEEARMQLICNKPTKLEYNLSTMLRNRHIPQWENFIL